MAVSSLQSEDEAAICREMLLAVGHLEDFAFVRSL